MKKIIFLIPFLMLSLQSFAPIKASWHKYDPFMENIYKKHCLINNNLVSLLDGNVKTRQEVYSAVQPLLEIYLKEYTYNYDIGDSLSYAIACIFLSESSNSKGKSAKSSLWLEYNNPFGLTTYRNSVNSVTKMSWEKINGERVPMYRTFKTFNNLESSVESLMWDYLLNDRYEALRYKKTVKEFLYGLYECGYMTNDGASVFWNNCYQKYK